MRNKYFHKKNYQNPLFPRRKKPVKNLKFKILSGAIVFLAVFFLYWINQAPFFQIKNINVYGTELINKSEVENLIREQTSKKRYLFFTQSNILFFNKFEVKKILAKNYYFQELKVVKKYFNSIEINIKEESTALILVTDNKKFNLNKFGKVIMEYKSDQSDVSLKQGQAEIIRPLITSSQIPIIFDKSNSQVFVGQQSLPKETVDFLLNINDELKNQIDFNIAQYTIENSKLDEITAITNEGWEIRFKTTDSVKSQSVLLSLVLKEKISDRKNLKYIDLRFGNKINYQ